MQTIRAAVVGVGHLGRHHARLYVVLHPSDVLELGQEIEVRVEEIDDKGKVSLTPAGDPPAAKEGASSSNGGGDRAPRRERSERPDRSERNDRADRNDNGGDAADVVEVSFEDKFEEGLEEDLGDLGPSSGSRRRR